MRSLGCKAFSTRHRAKRNGPKVTFPRLRHVSGLAEGRQFVLCYKLQATRALNGVKYGYEAAQCWFSRKTPLAYKPQAPHPSDVSLRDSHEAKG